MQILKLHVYLFKHISDPPHKHMPTAPDDPLPTLPALCANQTRRAKLVASRAASDGVAVDILECNFSLGEQNCKSFLWKKKTS